MSLENFTFPEYVPLDSSLVHKFEAIPAVDPQTIATIEKNVKDIVNATKEYSRFILEKGRAGAIQVDEPLLQNYVNSLAQLLESKHLLTTFADSVKLSKVKIRQDLRNEQPLTLETLEYHQQNSTAKSNIADIVISDHQEAISLAQTQNSLAAVLRSLEDYQYVKNVAFVLAHPEDPLPDDVEDEELAISGGKVSLKDPISLQYFQNPVVYKQCNHVYEESNILARLGDGQLACPIDGCSAQIRRQGLQVDEIMKLRVLAYLAFQQRREVDRI